MPWAALLWIATVAAAGEPATSESEGAVDIRALPTLVVHWERSETRVYDVAVDDGVAYARSRRDLEAIEIASGQTLWKLSLDQRIAQGPVLLDERLAVIIDGGTLVLVDRVSGRVTAERPLHGAPYHGPALAGPPLVAAIHRDGGGTELLRLDDINGRRLDRLPIDRLASLRSVRGTTVASFESGGRSRLIGIQGRDLTPAWEHPILAWRLYEDGDHAVVSVQDPAAAYRALDPGDGTVETELPEWPSATAEEGVWRLAWDLEVAGQRPPVTLRRLDPGSDRPLWETQLPCRPSAWTRNDGRLVLDCRPPDRGRGLLLVIDLTTGEILRRAPGFHVVSTLEVVDDLGLAASRDGLVAFSLTEKGPAIAETQSVEQEVDALLKAARQRRASAEESAANLSRIGDAALPLLTRKLPALDGRAAQVAATVLGNAAYSLAAGVVAERLRTLPALDRSEGCGEQQRIRHQNLKLALIAALGKLGGDEAASLLGPFSTDPAEPRYVRQQAAFALAELATVEALEWLDRARTSTQRTRWWKPPSADAWLAVLSSSPIEGAGKYAGSPPWERRDQATLASGGDRRIVVFPDPAAGNWQDLWAAEIEADGTPGTPMILGVSLEGLGRAWEPPTLAGRVAGGRLVLTGSPGDRTANVDLETVRRDRDGDSLGDLMEERFGTDVALADTDGDGIPDPEDLVPQAPPALSLDDEERIAVAVMDSFFRYGNQWRDGVAFIEADRPLPWTGRTGPTFTVAPERVEELRRELGSWLAPVFGVHRAGRDEVDEERLEALDLAEGDHLYIVSAPQEGHFAIVRRVGDRWVVREIRLSWIA